MRIAVINVMHVRYIFVGIVVIMVAVLRHGQRSRASQGVVSMVPRLQKHNVITGSSSTLRYDHWLLLVHNRLMQRFKHHHAVRFYVVDSFFTI